MAERPRGPRPLAPLRQFRHRRGGVNGLAKSGGDATVTGFVKYDPGTADTIVKGKLFDATTLRGFLASGHIPVFSSTAISLKPVYRVMPAKQALGGRYAQLANWPGPPKTPAPFGSDQWHDCVWIDLQEPGPEPLSTPPARALVARARRPRRTGSAGSCVHFKLSAAEAAARNAFVQTLDAPQKAAIAEAATGDYAVLIAMHVTTREISRWTWSTFWWSPVADDPPAPSSKVIAAQRAPQLAGAARNYAGCTADMMESPPQPETGGSNAGESVYCYNPWLEAGFGPDDLPDSQPGTYQGATVANNVGVQTNCMSCHAAAAFDPDHVPNAPQYSGDRYVDQSSAPFKGTVTTDFLWSIADNAH
jgi:hypothetical protein